MQNPYVRAWRQRRSNQRRESGWLQALQGWLPVLALGAAGPVIRPVFMAWLEDEGSVPMGVAGLSLRLGMLLAGAMSLGTYSALVRGPERAILDPFPAHPRALIRYLAKRTAWERASLPVGAAALLLPILLAGYPLAWLLASIVAVGGWFVGLMAGFTVHLGSVWAAESPALGGILNLIRGQNPQLQAALIYGPGVALGVGTAAVFGASEGARLVLMGQPLGALLLVIPLVVGLVAFLPAGGLAERYHFRTTLILAEIDAAYAVEERDPEEARRVYLEWLVRLLPQRLHLEFLKELRHGWRGLRSWLTGAWGLGILCLISAWSSEPSSWGRSLAIALAALVAIACVGLRLSTTDPLWLDQTLPQKRSLRLSARALAIFAWLQGVILPPTIALVLRQGGGAALSFLGITEAAALALCIASACFSPLRSRGWVPYLLSGLLLWGGLVGGFAV